MNDRQATLQAGLEDPKDLENFENLQYDKKCRRSLQKGSMGLLGPEALNRRRLPLLKAFLLGSLLVGIGYVIIRLTPEEGARVIGALAALCGAALLLIAVVGYWVLKSGQSFHLRMHHTELRCVAMEMDEELRVLEDLVLQIAESNDPAAAQKRLQNAILLRKRRRAT